MRHPITEKARSVQSTERTAVNIQTNISSKDKTRNLTHPGYTSHPTSDLNRLSRRYSFDDNGGGYEGL